MNDFTTKKTKPTAKEYLGASLDDIIERLNINPCGDKSEDPFIQAVITVRAAKISERLSSRLNCVTAVIAIATVFLVAIPFLTPSIEKKQLEEGLKEQSQLINVQRDQLRQLDQAILKLTQEQNSLSTEVKKLNKILMPTERNKPAERPEKLQNGSADH